MANEKKTEAIVRTHFEQFKYSLLIEEQQSDNAKIRKLLATASKKGTGNGRPEFLISFNTNLDLLVVIECKADVTKHESPDRNKYADFAVDGVLLYSSYLSKDFDVLAIAVSGETKENLKISHFLHLRNEKKAIDIFADKLLTADDYLNGYLKSPEKFRQDYNTLLEFTKKLNEGLHSHKIPEKDRALLISCILIGLENLAFKTSYASHLTPKSLANALVQTVSSELESANISGEKLKNLELQFSFIQTDTSLSKKDSVLKNLINEIDENINQFIKTHEYIDVLGQLYIEFLRYANSDKGLGIVLTPPHISELFTELAQVNKHSIVYDNCTGTGGFLISSMKKMIADSKGDQKNITSIKSSQLIGVEYQSHIFALAVSNMYIHQDGKTNIINDNCLDPKVITQVRTKKPTVGFLNPPYKSDKKTDIDELQFILSNLECLVDGAKCIAIVPMQSALAQKGKVLEYKKTLLAKHTLEAVLSMPDELFFNSKVGVVSCVMIFTAHKPHPKSKETFFGYFKDDGFIKRKMLGRVDADNKWDSIKESWITLFLNKKEKAGFSINQVVSAKDEWCAEAYMQTNYASLTDDCFIDTMCNYVTFLLGNRLSNQVTNKPFTPTLIPLSLNTWGIFNLVDLFNISGSKTTPLLELEEYGKGEFPFVTTQATNNGVEGFYNFSTELGNVLTVDSAVLGYCSYQSYNFSASDHVEILKPKFEMTKYVAMFLVTIMNLEKYRYNYGRKCSQSRMKKIAIKLPTKDGKPDFVYMENYIKSLPYSESI